MLTHEELGELDPEVCVIIPTKNRAHFLASALRSVLNQTFKDFEIIVIDAASADNTDEVASRFKDKRIIYVREDKDKGISAARNMGIRLSKARLIAFLDDDDCWLPGKLEKQLRLIRSNKSIGGVYTGAWIIDDNGKTVGHPWLPSKTNNKFSDLLEKNYIGNCSGMLVKRECLERVGYFDETLSAAEDYDMWIRLTRNYRLLCVEEPLFFYRVHKRRITSNPHANLKAGKLILSKFLGDLNTLENRRKVMGHWCYQLGKLYCQTGDTKNGRLEFVEAVKNNPHSFIYPVFLCTALFGWRIFNALHKIEESLLPLYLQIELS